VQYPNISSAIRPVPHGKGLPIPDPPPPPRFSLDSDEEEKNTPEETTRPSASSDQQYNQSSF
jgi:hypothetical protein